MNAKQPLMVPRVIWFALTISQFIYALIAYTLHPQTPGDTYAQLLIPFLGVSVIEAFISIAFFRKYLANMALTPQELAAPDSSAILRAKVGKAFVPLIVALAMNESICIFGFLLAFLGGQIERMLPFMAVSLALNAYMFPRFPEKR